MRIKIFFFIIFNIIVFSISAQNKNSLKAYLDHKQFYHPEIGNFIEIHIQFVAYSMKYLPVDGGLKSELAIQYAFKNEKDSIVNSDAYRLKSPLMKDSIIEDFFELKRIVLPPGKYKFDLSLTDINNEKDPITTYQEIEVIDFGKNILISNIVIAELISKTREETVFSKSGYEIVPRISNYFSAKDNTLPVYFELYNSISDSLVVGLKQAVLNSKSKVEVENLTRFTKISMGKIQPIIRAIDITTLPSGEYELVYSLISKENKEITQISYPFERFNENYQEIVSENIILDPTFQASISDDSLKFYIASLIPISKEMEVKNILKVLKIKNVEAYRKYFQAFWAQNSENGKALDNWLKYKAQVLLVQRLYKNTGNDGFETDRGRVYLQYGPPNNIITREISSNEVPYEIWRYDKIKIYSNRKFIFYDPNLINDYRLLHSDVLGEAKNPRWQQFLQKRGNHNKDAYDNKDGLEDQFGNKSGEFFNQY